MRFRFDDIFITGGIMYTIISDPFEQTKMSEEPKVPSYFIANMRMLNNIFQEQNLTWDMVRIYYSLFKNVDQIRFGKACFQAVKTMTHFPRPVELGNILKCID